MSGPTFYGGYNKYLEELSSSGGSIYAALQGGELQNKKMVIGLGIAAAVVVGLNILMYNQTPSTSSGSTASSGRRQRRQRRQ